MTGEDVNQTDINTALLEKRDDPRIYASNKALCRKYILDDPDNTGGWNPDANQACRRFVSQGLIKLLTKSHITQANGKCYTDWTPKGFLQHTDLWLAERQHEIVGYPRGLQQGSISYWPMAMVFSVAAMFINETIHIMPIGSCGKKRKRVDIQPSDVGTRDLDDEENPQDIARVASGESSTGTSLPSTRLSPNTMTGEDVSQTDINSALLAKCDDTHIYASNKALCRRHILNDTENKGKWDREAHDACERFVSQSFIRLLTMSNITKGDGRPYTSHAPKGFLQHPDLWLAEREHKFVGFPRGLPQGQISHWPMAMVFSVSVMFIKKTIDIVSIRRHTGRKRKRVPEHAPDVQPSGTQDLENEGRPLETKEEPKARRRTEKALRKSNEIAKAKRESKTDVQVVSASSEEKTRERDKRKQERREKRRAERAGINPSRDPNTKASPHHSADRKRVREDAIQHSAPIPSRPGKKKAKKPRTADEDCGAMDVDEMQRCGISVEDIMSCSWVELQSKMKRAKTVSCV